MSSILFTDADGTWRLHNGKPFPASRFQGWTPDSQPFGDVASALADGAITRLRLRTDYSVAFELPMIPSRRSSNLVLQPENFGATWAAVGTPTRVAAAHTRTGVTLDLIGDDSGAAEEYYQQTIAFSGVAPKAISICVKQGTIAPAGGAVVQLYDTTASITRFSANITFGSNGIPIIGAVTGTYFGYEALGDGVYRLLFATTTVTGGNTNTLLVVPAVGAANQGNIYAGGAQCEDAATPTPYLHTTTAARTGVSLVEIADRLRYHLLNGGTCTVYTNDIGGSTYATCGLNPGTTPQLALSDRRTMEFTLSVQLINLAGSPSRMLAHYAEQ